jgi:hypothetical protein
MIKITNETNEDKNKNFLISEMKLDIKLNKIFYGIIHGQYNR